MSTQLIQKAIKVIGSQAEMARQMGVTPQFVIKMTKTGHVPAERCRQIEHLTGGVVKAEELRPDVFGPFDPRIANSCRA